MRQARTKRRKSQSSEAAEFFSLKRRSFLQRALEGDQPGARSVLNAALLQRTSTQDAYRYILIPALKELGDAWAKGKISIAQEHVATEVIATELSVLRSSLNCADANGLTAVFAALPGDLHTLGPRIVADYFLMNGWKVIFLGNNTPASEILDFARKHRVDVIGLATSTSKHAREVTDLIRKLRKLDPAPKILIGGRASAKLQRTAADQRADAFPIDAEHAVSEARRLMGKDTGPANLESLAREIGERITASRHRKGLSQLELSRSAGLDRAYLSAIENGKHNATIGALLQIANALALGLTDLIGGKAEHPNSSSQLE